MLPFSERQSQDLFLVVYQASEAVMTILRRPFHKNLKADGSWVTEADKLSEKILIDGIRKQFPNHGILSEEYGLDGSLHSQYLWLVDPLDGSKAFATSKNGFSIMVGLLENGIPRFGIISDPMGGFFYEATHGQGAYIRKGRQRKKLYVSSKNRMREMALALSPDIAPSLRKRVMEQLTPATITEINSVGIKTALLLKREADIYLSCHPLHYWDTCAPQLILEEAGGAFTQINGMPLDYSNPMNPLHLLPTLATNNHCHRRLSEILLPLFQKNDEA